MKKRRKVGIVAMFVLGVTLFFALMVQGTNENLKIEKENTDIKTLNCVEYLIGQEGEVLVLQDGKWVKQNDLRPAQETHDVREYGILEKIKEERKKGLSYKLKCNSSSF